MHLTDIQETGSSILPINTTENKLTKWKRWFEEPEGEGRYLDSPLTGIGVDGYMGAFQASVESSNLSSRSTPGSSKGRALDF